MFRRMSVVALGFAVLLTAAASSGEPLLPADVPEPLRAWTEWVLHGHEDALCATLYAQAEARQCAWPARLALALDDGGGTFAQSWEVQRDLWVALPGAPAHWPQEVTVDGRAAAVVERGSVPHVHLVRGRHLVAGRFAWNRLPEMLPIPAATGLLDLTVGGAALAFPNRDAQGGLWLQRREETSGEESRIDVVVHRAVRDDIPLVLITRIQLDVAGKGREVQLGPVLPPGLVPMALDSPLPARLEADGRLRLQVRAGRWLLEIQARHDGRADRLSAPRAEAPWDASEVWVFEAQPDLRLVSVEGVDAIDPQQTDLPGEWRQLPAYVLRPGDAMQLVERRRGDADPAPDQLALERTLWLDFDGGGYTVEDHLTGTLARSARLDMAPPTVLGRVAIDGADQFITRLGDDQPPGVEVRTRALELDADSRLDGALRVVPVVGWEEDFQAVSAKLYLPPGWRLLHATGVDEAAPTWVATWTLLDLFAVLITALAAARLYGWRWGAVALVAVGLSYTEPGAPRWIWLAVLAAEALRRLVPTGRLSNVLRLARVASLVVLVAIAFPFALGQVRQALYPSLEQPYAYAPVQPRRDAISFGAPAQPPPPVGADRYMHAARERDDKPAAAKESRALSRSYKAYIDPRAVVQTGPGLPSWIWQSVALRWSGPVERGQHMQLLLLPPWANSLLALARALLVAALVVLLVRWRRAAVSASAVALTLVNGAAIALVLLGAGPTRADFPPTQLLDELRARLLERPDCHPLCAAFPRLRLEVATDSLRARLQADVAAATAVPLPGQAQQWLPRTVIVDGQPDAVTSQDADGFLWLRLEPGIHDLLLAGPLPARDTVQIPLPLAPHRVEAQVVGWTLDGLRENGVPETSLQLTRTAPTDGERFAPLQPNQLPPFARVERTLRLPLTWEVETRLVRLTPADAALLLEVPLLPGEAVTTAEMRVVDGKAQINLPARATEVTWRSTLAETSPIQLRAPEAVPWVETWRLDASPIWHVEASGIPPIHVTGAGVVPLREWRPWPGEQVALEITQPEGVGGQTLTIDSSEIWVSPGLRATDVTLGLALRSSRGSEHTLTLPEGAELQWVKIDGGEQPIRQQGRGVVLPIAPGAQRIELRWRQPDGIATLLHTPVVDLGMASVNADLHVAISASRWILFAGGPRLGPAVLFWSLLPVILLVAVGLGRVRLTPLRAVHWFLLGVGLTQVEVVLGLVVVGWLLALGWRRQRGHELGARGFDAAQVLLVAWTGAAVVVLVIAIQRGLLGAPDMQIAGNESTAALLRWYADRAGATLPQAWVLSAPLLVYRVLMLAWALWIALALLRWLRWGWECLGSGGYWRRLRQAAAAPVANSGKS